MTIKAALTRWLVPRTTTSYLLWALAPLLCLAVLGPGVFAATLYIVALLLLARLPFSELGFRWPGVRQFGLTLVFALILAGLLSLFANVVFEPLITRLVGTAPNTSAFADLAGDLGKLMLYLAVSWLVGALIEELVFRGFIIGFGIRVFGGRASWLLVLLSAAVFGLSHLYQGLSGVILTGVIGLLLGVVFVVSRRNLLLVILIHGFVDSISFLTGFFSPGP